MFGPGKSVGRSLASNSRRLSYTSKQNHRRCIGVHTALPSRHAMVESQSAQPVSFLFAVKDLEINDDTQQGGIEPRADYDHWMPPIYTAGYIYSPQASLYRWRNGEITAADTDYESTFPSLTPYRTATVFYCDQWLHFQVAVIDPSRHNMATAEDHLHRWYRLTFHHDAGISRVDIAGPEVTLSGTAAHWASPLGLDPYCPNSDTVASRGLAGDISILIALIAFSCSSDDLQQVLLNDEAWHHNNWRGHNYHHGSK